MYHICIGITSYYNHANLFSNYYITDCTKFKATINSLESCQYHDKSVPDSFKTHHEI